MSPQPETLLTIPRFLISTLPLAILAAAILKFRLPLFWAGLTATLVALFLATAFLGAGLQLLLYALGKGAAFTAFIALFLVTAIFFYHVVKELGIIDAMGKRLLFLSGRPLLQALVLAWCFGGFMEGIVGFGIPVVLVSPLLVVGGVTPFKAVALTLVGHAWAVTYGTLGVAFFILALASRIPSVELVCWVAFQIGLAFLLSGFAVAHIFGGLRAVRDGAPGIILAAAGTTSVFFILAAANLPQLSALLGGMTGALLLMASGALPGRQKESPRPAEADNRHVLPLTCTFAPYFLLFISVLLFQSAPLGPQLAKAGISFSFPALSTSLGYFVPAEPNFVRLSLRHPAFAIMTASVLSFLLLRLRRLYLQPFPRAVLREAGHRAASTTATLFVLVSTAMIMNDTGMTTILAMGTSRLTASFYPVLAPFIGVLGTFLTGSNTNSNLLFGLFQHQAALNISTRPHVLVTAHTAAAAVASSIAPAKILIAASAVGLKGKERSLLAVTLPYCLGIALVIGLVAFFIK